MKVYTILINLIRYDYVIVFGTSNSSYLMGRDMGNVHCFDKETVRTWSNYVTDIFCEEVIKTKK